MATTEFDSTSTSWRRGSTCSSQRTPARGQGGAHAERRHGVAAAELFGLPWPVWLEAVGGDDVGDVIEEPGQVPGEVGVPGVGVDEVGALRRRRQQQVDRQRLEGGVVG